MRLLLAALLACLLWAAPASAASYAGAPAKQAGLTLPARVQGGGLALATKGGFAPRFWPGVNLGATTPGHHPGEVAPTRADYARWIAGMHDVGARVVRVYTILRPGFYEALAAHNRRHAGDPLYVIHGVWIPEEELLATGDAYAPEVTEGFDREIADAVAVVHGDARLPRRPGHASGTYRADISRWLLAWSPGIEWDPGAVASTDARHAGRPPHQGRYVTATASATPMESWLAARLDRLAALEAARGWSRPVTFTNWVTADPLRHPAEPNANEDAVSIDATHLQATPAWPGGLFASYHVYPYYPDFLRHEYGGPDPYASYLRALRAHHGAQPVMVTEFGVPDGIGIAHDGPLGRTQGGHSEREQGRLNAGMLRAIAREGYAGGMLFAYVDEWFKRTWNTLDLQFGERRPLWRDALTNEQSFGLVATEPATRRRARTVLRRSSAGSLRATHDEGHLTLTLSDVRKPVVVGIDNRPGGAGGLPGRPGAAPDADVAVEVAPSGATRVLQAAAWEHVEFLYAQAHGYLPRASGPWIPARLMLNRPLVIPTTGARLPAQVRDVSRLPVGRGPEALVHRRGSTVEVRLPWSMLGYADPSSGLLYAPQPDASIRFVKASTPRIAVAGPAGAAAAGSYRVPGWNTVRFTERRKAGWGAVRGAFRAAAR
jgi:hypothetical protein